MGEQKSDKVSTRIENIVKIVSTVLTVCALCWGIYQYQSENERNLRKYIFDKKFDTYNRYLSLISDLATTDKDSTFTLSFQKKYKDFEKIHFGEMILIKDSVVSAATTEFYISINKFRQKRIKISNSDLRVIIGKLAKSCRVSLNETWNGNFNGIFQK